MKPIQLSKIPLRGKVKSNKRRQSMRLNMMIALQGVIKVKVRKWNLKLRRNYEKLEITTCKQ